MSQICFLTSRDTHQRARDVAASHGRVLTAMLAEGLTAFARGSDEERAASLSTAAKLVQARPSAAFVFAPRRDDADTVMVTVTVPEDVAETLRRLAGGPPTQIAEAMLRGLIYGGGLRDLAERELVETTRSLAGPGVARALAEALAAEKSTA